KFDAILENDHVIKESQISFNILNRGPDSNILSAKFDNRRIMQNLKFKILKRRKIFEFFMVHIFSIGNSNFLNDEKYLNSLWCTLINLMRCTPGGLLIFFGSYSHMQKCLEFW
uniref:Uncharacterized protein n=1 Tax=Romanomermis culicivorax TaxID=13658 RepID=A0A915J4P8_ROMCU